MTVTGSEDWRILVDRKRKQVDSQIPTAWRLDSVLLASTLDNGKLLEANIPRRSGILSQQEIDITEHYSAEQLLRRLARGEMTSLVVTTAFCKRAAIAQQLVRFLSFFPAFFLFLLFLSLEGINVGEDMGFCIVMWLLFYLLLFILQLRKRETRR